jgi:hypothetical protein
MDDSPARPAEAGGPTTAPPYRRAVFYVAGFDIMGPRFYHLMFKRGLALDSSLYRRKYKLHELTPTPPVSRAWRIETSDGPRSVEAGYFLLTPHDRIMQSYRLDALWVARAWIVALYGYLRYGALAASLTYSWRNGLMLIYVLVLLFGFFAIGAAAGFFALKAIWSESPIALRALLGVATGLGVLQLGLRLEKRTFAGLLLSSMYTGLQQAGGRRPDLDAVIDGFARHIADTAERERWDEILIVGHSSGTMMAIDVAAQVFGEAARFGATRLSLLTLGSTDGVVSLFRHARRQRDALVRAATAKNLTWIEFHSNRDWVCLGGRNPVVQAGVDLAGKPQTGPIMMRLSVKDFYSPKRRKQLGFNPFERHFDYLRAGDKPSRYSYYRFLCAAMPLADSVRAPETPERVSG